jgi:hypothetical protein
MPNPLPQMGQSGSKTAPASEARHLLARLGEISPNRITPWRSGRSPMPRTEKAADYDPRLVGLAGGTALGAALGYMFSGKKDKFRSVLVGAGLGGLAGAGGGQAVQIHNDAATAATESAGQADYAKKLDEYNQAVAKYQQQASAAKAFNDARPGFVGNAAAGVMPGNGGTRPLLPATNTALTYDSAAAMASKLPVVGRTLGRTLPRVPGLFPLWMAASATNTNMEQRNDEFKDILQHPLGTVSHPMSALDRGVVSYSLAKNLLRPGMGSSLRGLGGTALAAQVVGNTASDTIDALKTGHGNPIKGFSMNADALNRRSLAYQGYSPLDNWGENWRLAEPARTITAPVAAAKAYFGGGSSTSTPDTTAIAGAVNNPWSAASAIRHSSALERNLDAGVPGNVAAPQTTAQLNAKPIPGSDPNLKFEVTPGGGRYVRDNVSGALVQPNKGWIQQHTSPEVQKQLIPRFKTDSRFDASSFE